MSEIKIQRAHALPVRKARALAERVAEQLKHEFDLDYVWQGQTLRFSRDGVQGALIVAKEEIRIHAQLGFLLSFLKPRIEQEILTQLEKMFEAENKPARAARRRPARRRV
jgi:putative polyhydroxyalkanoate system protein